METIPATAPAPATEPPPLLPARRRHGVLLLAFVVVAWVLPGLTHRLHADAVLPVLLLLGIASLLRGGRTILDRLALALLMLLGAVSVAGLVFSIWPWGLDPVPVARAGFFTLIAAGLVSRRWPSLPLRTSWADALVLAGGVGPALYLWSSFWGKPATERLAMLVGAEDLARHFTIFDTIRTVGGYLPFHRDEITRRVIPGVVDYPQASHLFSALMDNFVRSSTDPGDGWVAFDHYLAWNLVGYGILAFALVWGVRWVAGPALRGWRLVAAVSVIAACTGGGYFVSLFGSGYPSEAMGLSLLAMVFALAARPVRGPKEQALLLAAGVVGISFTYYFFAPVACAVVLAWACFYWRFRWGSLAIAVVAAPLVLAWPVISLRSGVSPGRALLPDVGIPEIDRRWLVALCVLVLLGTVLRRAGRRNPVWRSVGSQLLISLLMVAAIGLYQWDRTGGVSYYFEKSLHAVLVCAFVGLGAVSLLLPRVRFPIGAAPVRWFVTFALPAGASGLVVAFAFGLLVPNSMLHTRTSERGGVTEPAAGTSRGRTFHAARLWRPNDGKGTVNTYRAFPNGDDGTVTIILTGYRLYTPSLFLAALRRQGGEAALPVGGLNGARGIKTVEHVAEVSPKPVRFVISDARDDLLRGLTDIQRRRPELEIQIVRLPAADVPNPQKLPPPWR
ncbi:hypothetical protein [Cryptosporangium phraense]|uniref:Uncharacterized protein n=1 Tax=Cryptosporangium phraense TaxID=2593070 RepID=A0A545APF8_9ACTN|nr:hypothetical protein [Cryptosporangium phraense]TQS43209.1 hypothetical protein FL583_20405 [Cryptosporangium phraense]